MTSAATATNFHYDHPNYDNGSDTEGSSSKSNGRSQHSQQFSNSKSSYSSSSSSESDQYREFTPDSMSSASPPNFGSEVAFTGVTTNGAKNVSKKSRKLKSVDEKVERKLKV
jgi:hypothetical protein